MKKLVLFFTLCACGALTVLAQAVKSRVVEDGGTGPFKAQMTGDGSCPGFTIYRPQKLDEAGPLPIILYGNGGCANSTVEIRFFLNELASYGYLAIGIGPYDDEDTNEHWKQSLSLMAPEGKKIVLSNGEEVIPPTPDEVQARIAAFQKMAEDAMKTRTENQEQSVSFADATYAQQLLEALDWLSGQNADPASEYYHKLDLDKVTAMGQSCGGSQVLAVAHDPRIKSCVILNSGIGDMEMQGATQANLETLHTPMFYLIGGPSDVAYPNAALDFQRIKKVPVVLMNTLDGHLGTYYERSGGAYAIAVRKWLDWQMKGDTLQRPFFLDDDTLHAAYPDWTVDRKNWL